MGRYMAEIYEGCEEVRGSRLFVECWLGAWRAAVHMAFFTKSCIEG